MLQIKGIEKTSLSDYPGRVAAVVFMAGCNFRCPFCHNKDLVLRHEKLDTIPEEDVLAFLKSRREWLDGVVLSGGEPTLCDGLPAFMEKLKGLGYLVKLDTNGTNPRMLEEVIGKGLADYIAMDIKGPLAGYAKASGVQSDIQSMKESIRTIIDSGVEHEFRSTVLPAIHAREDVEAMARLVSGGKRYFLQQFRPKNTLDPNFEKEKPFTAKEMEELKRICGKYVETRVRLA